MTWPGHDRSEAPQRVFHGCRGWIALVLLAGGTALSPACDRGPTTAKTAREHAGPRSSEAAVESGGVDAATPDTADPAAQMLDSGLNAANRALRAGQFELCRQEVEAYLGRAGGAARKGQAEFMIGLSYHRPRLFGEARPHFARAIELEPGYFATYYFYGYCLFNLGRLEEADRTFATYLEHKPNVADALFGRGLVALEADRVDDAQRWIQNAIEICEKKRQAGDKSADLRKDMARYESRLSDVYLRRDDLPRAKQALETAVELWPDFFETWSKLHRVLLRLGETAAAEKALAKYQELFERQTKGLGGMR
jgi:tetratricopeptide (TPR) repeat protein